MYITNCEVTFFFNHFNLYNYIIRKKKLEAKVKKLEGNWHSCCPANGSHCLCMNDW